MIVCNTINCVLIFGGRIEPKALCLLSTTDLRPSPQLNSLFFLVSFFPQGLLLRWQRLGDLGQCLQQRRRAQIRSLFIVKLPHSADLGILGLTHLIQVCLCAMNLFSYLLDCFVPVSKQVFFFFFLHLSDGCVCLHVWRPHQCLPLLLHLIFTRQGFSQNLLATESWRSITASPALDYRQEPPQKVLGTWTLNSGSHAWTIFLVLRKAAFTI